MSCSGMLINQNTNGRPRQLLLTARHCIRAGEFGGGDLLTLNNWEFAFNFQSPNGDVAAIPNTLPFSLGNRGEWPLFRYAFRSNVNLLYESTAITSGYGVDIALLEIQQPIPPHFNPYFAGWKPDGLLGTNGALNAPMRLVHHPAGDAKKVSASSIVTKNDLPVATQCRVVTKVIDAIIGIFGGRSITESVCGWVDIPQYLVAYFTYGSTRGGSSGSPMFTSAGRVFGVLSSGFPSELVDGECANIFGASLGKFRNAYANRPMRDALNPSYSPSANLVGIDGRDIGCYPDNVLRLSGNYFPANRYQPNNFVAIRAQNSIEAGQVDSDGNGFVTSAARIDANGFLTQQPTGNGIEESFLRIYDGADFEFTAGQTISLLNGFTVENGARFTARIANCNGSARVATETPSLPNSAMATERVSTDEEKLLTVSPNPISSSFQYNYKVRQSGEVNINLYDIQGRLLSNIFSSKSMQPGDYQGVKDVSDIKAGVYLIQLITSSDKTSQKILIQR